MKSRLYNYFEACEYLAFIKVVSHTVIDGCLFGLVCVCVFVCVFIVLKILPNATALVYLFPDTVCVEFEDCVF